MKKHNNEGIEGATFGIMGGIIATLGIIFGLSVVQDRFILILGILVAGVADAFADSAAMHVSEESEAMHTKRQIWKSTFFTFVAKSIVVVIMLLPFFFLPIYQAVITSGILGIVMLAGLGKYVSSLLKEDSSFMIIKYVAAGVFVSSVCYLLGNLVHSLTINL